MNEDNLMRTSASDVTDIHFKLASKNLNYLQSTGKACLQRCFACKKRPKLSFPINQVKCHQPEFIDIYICVLSFNRYMYINIFISIFFIFLSINLYLFIYLYRQSIYISIILSMSLFIFLSTYLSSFLPLLLPFSLSVSLSLFSLSFHCYFYQFFSTSFSIQPGITKDDPRL